MKTIQWVAGFAMVAALGVASVATADVGPMPDAGGSGSATGSGSDAKKDDGGCAVGGEVSGGGMAGAMAAVAIGAAVVLGTRRRK
jgi:MYXO-CTERM domain-containing protein